MKVNIKNYEIIEDAELEFENGLNIIVGETNEGKSSVFRAIKSAVFNELGDYFIRMGESQTEVLIEDGEDEVKWTKRQNKSPSTVYEINGERFSKVGRTQFEKVADVLNIKEIKLTSNEKERVNFWKQMKYPFLLDKSSSQLFEFLSLSSEDDNLTKIIKEMNSDLGDIESKIDKKEAKVDTLKDVIDNEEEYLDSKEGFEDIYEEILDLESDYHDYEELEDICKSLDNLNKKFRKFKDIKERSDELMENINPLIKDCEDMLDVYDKLGSKIKYLNKLIGNKNKMIQRVRKVDSFIDSVDLKSLKENIEEYSNLERKFEELNNLLTDIGKLKNNRRHWVDKIKKNRNKIEKIKKVMEEEFEVCPLCGSTDIN